MNELSLFSGAGGGLLGTLLLGSVARDILKSHHRPVMLVGPGSPGIYPRSG